MDAFKTAKALGVLSIGLGAAELLAPRFLASSFGTTYRPGLVRTLFGARGIAAGAGILASRRNPGPFVWSRVLGDVVDLAALGVSMRRNSRKATVAAAIAAVAGLAALDYATARRLTPG
jgi:hypothetical protein